MSTVIVPGVSVMHWLKINISANSISETLYENNEGLIFDFETNNTIAATARLAFTNAKRKIRRNRANPTVRRIYPFAEKRPGKIAINPNPIKNPKAKCNRLPVLLTNIQKTAKIRLIINGRILSLPPFSLGGIDRINILGPIKNLACRLFSQCCRRPCPKPKKQGKGDKKRRGEDKTSSVWFYFHF